MLNDSGHQFETVAHFFAQISWTCVQTGRKQKSIGPFEMTHLERSSNLTRSVFLPQGADAIQMFSVGM